VVAKLSDAFRQTLETSDIRTRMVQQGADPAFMPADAFAAYLAAQMPVWAKAVKDSGTRLD
jgi:tripartite-type tricarboxylate transporter receptor subunit TctC